MNSQHIDSVKMTGFSSLPVLSTTANCKILNYSQILKKEEKNSSNKIKLFSDTSLGNVLLTNTAGVAAASYC